MENLPRLRALEVIRLPEEEDASFLLRDPEGYSDDELVLSEPALFVAAHLDGEHSLEQLHQGFRERYGDVPPPEAIQGLIQRLDEAAMLETPAFAARRRDQHESFRAAAVRAPSHAGAAYPAEAGEAAETVAGFYRDAADLEEAGERPAGTLRGLVAPHIDLRVGGACSALAYQLLAEAPQVDTVLVLGTSHACPHPAWIVTDKPYETPLGTVPVDEEAVRRLSAVAAPSVEDLYLHRKEHSIEFQALFLADLLRQGRQLRMVSVLCGSIRGTGPASLFGDGDEAPARRSGILLADGSPAPASASPAPEPPSAEDDPFLREIRALLEERGDRMLVLAGADLAHVGPRFGDPGALNEEGLAYLEGQDRATLARVVEGDATGFFYSVVTDGDPRRICGLTPVYALLAALPGAKGKLLCYEQANDPSGTVSYASVGLWG